MGRRIPRQIPLMHPHPAVDAHEIIHLRPLEPRPRRPPVLAVIDVRQDHIPIRILVVPVDRRLVIDILFRDPVASRARVIALSP